MTYAAYILLRFPRYFVTVLLLVTCLICLPLAPALAGETISYPGAALRPGLIDQNTVSLYPVDPASYTGNSVTVDGGPLISGSVTGATIDPNAFPLTPPDVNGNKVYFKNGATGFHVIGAITSNAIASGNSVFISGGTVGGKAAGGVSLSLIDPGPLALSTNNELHISGGTVTEEAFGGYSQKSATHNSLDITGGSVGWGVAGGRASILDQNGSLVFAGDANFNNVTISGGRVGFGTLPAQMELPENAVYGGFTYNGNAMSNFVNITEGQINGNVYGGYIRGVNGVNGGIATDNIVNIRGGTISGDVYGGYGGSGSGTATGNTVNIFGNPDLATSSLYGGYVASPSGSFDFFTGNTLNMAPDTPLAVKGLANFQFYNFTLPAAMPNGTALVTATDAVNMTGSTVAVTSLGSSTGMLGQSFTLLNSLGGLTGTPGNLGAGVSGTPGTGGEWTYTMYADTNKLGVFMNQLRIDELRLTAPYAVAAGNSANQWVALRVDNNLSAPSVNVSSGAGLTGQAAALLVGGTMAVDSLTATKGNGDLSINVGRLDVTGRNTSLTLNDTTAWNAGAGTGVLFDSINLGAGRTISVNGNGA